MTTLDLSEIETRIKDAQLEMATLSQRYDAMVAEFNQLTQEHNNRLTQHQQRYQQCVGAVAALEQLKRLLTHEVTSNNENQPAVNRLANITVEPAEDDVEE
jgi:vacuolar-type H+-ATPase subunit D/Vma8